VHRNLIAKIVAVYHVQGDTEFDGCAQRIRTYQVTAMNDSLRPGRLCFGNSRCERLCTIMTVGDDADFHCTLSCSRNAYY
jgi:hypothetical protein